MKFGFPKSSNLNRFSTIRSITITRINFKEKQQTTAEQNRHDSNNLRYLTHFTEKYM